MTEPTFPPCDFRLIDTRARCNNPACIYCGCFVEPKRCQQCLDDPLSERPARLQPTRKHRARKSVTQDDTPPDPPNLIRRVFSYTEAVARWMVAGRPERPDKEVERIFHQHCKTCKWFDPERQLCRGCGCRVAEDGVAVLNKIKMATENCPRDFW